LRNTQQKFSLNRPERHLDKSENYPIFNSLTKVIRQTKDETKARESAPGLDLETWDSSNRTPLFLSESVIMPKGLVRYQQCGCFHFITFGCYHCFEHLGTSRFALKQLAKGYVLQEAKGHSSYLL
jgi:hypothetical protein